jgi:anti-anti-sigma factor
VTPFSSVVIEASGSARLILRGELDAASVRGAQRAFDEVLDRGPGRLILDLRELDFMDSTGVKFLLDSRDAAGQRELEVALAYDEGVVERVLTVSGLASLFKRD